LERTNDNKNITNENMTKKMEEVREESTSKTKKSHTPLKGNNDKKISTKTQTIIDPLTGEKKIITKTTILEKD
jgi:hypothetical protein